MAVPIRVAPAVAVQEFNLQTRSNLPLITLHGRIQTKDGKPPLAGDRPQVRIESPELDRPIDEEPIAVDANGRFTIELCDGIAYSAFASAGPLQSQIYSVPVEFTPTKDYDELVLTLDKTLNEFQKRKRQP